MLSTRDKITALNAHMENIREKSISELLDIEAELQQIDFAKLRSEFKNNNTDIQRAQIEIITTADILYKAIANQIHRYPTKENNLDEQALTDIINKSSKIIANTEISLLNRWIEFLNLRKQFNHLLYPNTNLDNASNNAIEIFDEAKKYLRQEMKYLESYPIIAPLSILIKKAKEAEQNDQQAQIVYLLSITQKIMQGTQATYGYNPQDNKYFYQYLNRFIANDDLDKKELQQLPFEIAKNQILFFRIYDPDNMVNLYDEIIHSNITNLSFDNQLFILEMMQKYNYSLENDYTFQYRNYLLQNISRFNDIIQALQATTVSLYPLIEQLYPIKIVDPLKPLEQPIKQLKQLCEILKINDAKHPILHPLITSLIQSIEADKDLLKHQATYLIAIQATSSLLLAPNNPIVQAKFIEATAKVSKILSGKDKKAIVAGIMVAIVGAIIIGLGIAALASGFGALLATPLAAIGVSVMAAGLSTIGVGSAITLGGLGFALWKNHTSKENQVAKQMEKIKEKLTPVQEDKSSSNTLQIAKDVNKNNTY